MCLLVRAHLEDEGLHLVLEEVEADLVGEQAVILQSHTAPISFPSKQDCSMC